MINKESSESDRMYIPFIDVLSASPVGVRVGQPKRLIEPRGVRIQYTAYTAYTRIHSLLGDPDVCRCIVYRRRGAALGGPRFHDFN